MISEHLLPSGAFTMRFKGGTAVVMPAWRDELRGKRGFRQIGPNELFVPQRPGQFAARFLGTGAPVSSVATHGGQRFDFDDYRR